MSLPDPQFNANGDLQHFIDLDGLNKDILTTILDTAESFTGVNDRTIKKVPLLRGKTVANLFFENSTRTRTAFELAAKRLSADILNVDLVTSSTNKGESLLDTLRVLESLQCDMFIVRHGESGAAHFIARHVAPNVNVVNGGDGQHSHPTQGMLDMFTIRRHKGDFSKLVVVLIGDIRHSRVARSDISALVTLGVGELRIVGPNTLIPAEAEALASRCRCHHGLATAKGKDAYRRCAKQWRVLQALRTVSRKTEARQTRRYRHASRTDQPRSRDSSKCGRWGTVGDSRTGHLRDRRTHGRHVNHHG